MMIKNNNNTQRDGRTGQGAVLCGQQDDRTSVVALPYVTY